MSFRIPWVCLAREIWTNRSMTDEMYILQWTLDDIGDERCQKKKETIASAQIIFW